jgi:hypothetical protein
MHLGHSSHVFDKQHGHLCLRYLPAVNKCEKLSEMFGCGGKCEENFGHDQPAFVSNPANKEMFGRPLCIWASGHLGMCGAMYAHGRAQYCNVLCVQHTRQHVYHKCKHVCHLFRLFVFHKFCECFECFIWRKFRVLFRVRSPRVRSLCDTFEMQAEDSLPRTGGRKPLMVKIWACHVR